MPSILTFPDKAVLTADIALSRTIAPALLEEKLREKAKEIEARAFRRKKTFEFYRGDSFQAIVPTEEALRIAIIWKAAVQSIEDQGKAWDIRIAIGLGAIDHLGEKASTSGGPAFEYSGTLLEELKQKDSPRIGIKTESPEWNRQLETECLLADTIMQRWSPLGAESIYYSLLFEETQEQLAGRLAIAQSSVHKRLNAANWAAIRYWEQYYRTTILDIQKQPDQ